MDLAKVTLEQPIQIPGLDGQPVDTYELTIKRYMQARDLRWLNKIDPQEDGDLSFIKTVAALCEIPEDSAGQIAVKEMGKVAEAIHPFCKDAVSFKGMFITGIPETGKPQSETSS